MEYVGLQAQKSANNVKSLLLLLLFPALILVLVYAFFLLVFGISSKDVNIILEYSNIGFLEIVPYVLLVVTVWFVIAYFANTYIIKKATHAEPLERKNDKRVYNLVENLCMANGMQMPKINIIYDDSLNAFASGINQRTFTITLSKGIIEKLNDEELEGVIAHELSHIRNRDVRLLIISIVFVGIFSFLMEMALHATRALSRGSRNSKGNPIVFIILILLLASIGYFFSRIFKLAISRRREYLADASAAEMTKKPWALASALRKVSEDSQIEAIKHKDVAQLFIEHPGKESKKKRSGLSSLFATHPPIEKRIQILEQF